MDEMNFDKSGRAGKYVLYFFLVAAVLALFFSFIDSSIFSKATGKISLDTMGAIYEVGEPIGGVLELSLFGGELVPKDSLVVVQIDDKTKEFSLSSLVSLAHVSGEFYAEGTDIVGFGKGYGVLGEKIIYPEVEFEIRISQKIGSTSGRGGGGSPSVSSADQAGRGDESGSDTAAPSDLDSGGGDSGKKPPITGGTVYETFFIISGKASKDNNFVYSIESNQDAEIVPGSVKASGFVIDDSSVDVRVRRGELIVSTDYSEKVEGFGEDFLADSEKLIAEIELSKFELIAEKSVKLISITLFYNGKILAKTEKRVSVVANEIAGENASGIAEENATANIVVDKMQTGAVLGKPVKWVQKIDLTEKEAKKVTVTLPEYAENVEVVGIVRVDRSKSGDIAERINVDSSRGEDVEDIIEIVEESLSSGQGSSGTVSNSPESASAETTSDESSAITGEVVAKLKLEKEGNFLISVVYWIKNLFGSQTGLVISDERGISVSEKAVDGNVVEVVDSTGQDVVQEVTIEYETPAPYAIESVLEDKKEVVIIGPDSVHYTDVLSFTNIPESFEVKSPNALKIFWKEKDAYVQPTLVSDINSNGVYDYVEWITPSLSNQTFIIEIIKAEHLDADKEFISDIYDEVKALDGVWSEAIPSEDYVRVTFERNLTSENDITLYPRIVSGNPGIEVYTFNGSEVIAVFDNLIPEEYNKVYLTGLKGEQDTFDLRVLNGDVEFDHIIDPDFEPSTVATLRAQACSAENLGAQNSYASACDGIYPGNCGGEEITDFLSCDDGSSETQTFNTAQYGGVNISSYNSSVTNCATTGDVFLCYEWWIVGSNPASCLIAVDADGGGSYSNVTTTCPGTSANPGLTCTNVTSLETWTCSNFFGSSGTRAMARDEITRTGIAAGGQVLTTDALFFNVTYVLADQTAPSVTINFPANTTYDDDDLPFIFNVSLNENGSLVQYSLDDGINNLTMSSMDNREHNATNSSIALGGYNFRVFANDTSGNNNYTASVRFTITNSSLITGCKELNVAGKTYVQGSSFVPAGLEACINITAQNVTFNGNGFSIGNTITSVDLIYSDQYGTVVNNVNLIRSTGLSSNVGIKLLNSNNSKVLNSKFSGNVGVSLQGVYNSNFSNNNFTTSDRGVNAVGTADGNNSFTNNSHYNANYGLVLGGDNHEVSASEFNNMTVNALFMSGNNYNVSKSIFINAVGAVEISSDGNNSRFDNLTFIDSVDTPITLSGNNHILQNMTVRNTNSSYYDIDFAGANRTNVIDSYFANYTFSGTGGILRYVETTQGEIYFLRDVNGSGTNLSNDIRLSNNLAVVESTNNIGLNRSANITFYNMPANFTEPYIFRDSSICFDCYNYTSLNAATVLFNVTSFTSYYIADLGQCLALPQCAEGSDCNVTSSCLLYSELCTNNICDFTNLKLNASLYTLFDSSGNGRNLVLNVSQNVTFLPGNQIVFRGKAGAQGGNGGIVNATVSNLFNRTNGVIDGVGGAGALTEGAAGAGGNGGIFQMNAHGFIRSFSSTNLAGGSGASSGTAGATIVNKNLNCPVDADVTGDGQITLADVLSITNNYNKALGQEGYNASYDINCDDEMDVVDLANIGFEYEDR